MNKVAATSIVKWIKNTWLDSDKICDYFKISRKERAAIREIAYEIRRSWHDKK